MSTTMTDRVLGLNEFFAASEARVDRWRTLNRVARALTATGPGAAGVLRLDPKELLAELAPLEGFCAYPGPGLMAQVHERLQTGDRTGFARLVQRISSALLSNSYRDDVEPWKADEEGEGRAPDILPPSVGRGQARRPYFEILCVSPADRVMWPEIRETFRRLRRVEDEFVYEPVVVGSFEDAVLAVVFNPNFQAVVISDGFGYASQYTVPALREILTRQVQMVDGSRSGDLGVLLAQMVRRWRPELDVYLTTDRDVAQLAGSAEAAPIRRIFYGVEEPMEIHLSVLDGVKDRYETPYFDNLKTLRPAPDRHLPRAADSPREVDLQVQLDPRHGGVLRGQPVPRRVVGDHRRPRQPARADRQHQGRAGQGGPRPRRRPQLLRHQRHVDVEQDRPPGAAAAGRHRPDRPRLPQVAPLRARAGRRPAALHRRLPADAVLDVRQPRHQADQEGAPAAEGRGQARSREAGGADQLHLRRSRGERQADHARVPRDQAGPHLPLGRGVVRVRALLAVPAPTHGDGRRRRHPRAGARPGVSQALRGVQGERRQAGSGRSEAPGHGAPARPRQGPRARVRDRLGAQVDVGAPPGLDHRRRRPGLPHGRGLLQGGVLHPHLDLAESAAHRVARRGAPADGARGLRARRPGHPAGDRDPA